jgi:hypothetical protein
MNQAKPAHIAFVVDDRLSRQRGAILTRVINSLRQCAKIDLIPGKIAEADLIKRLENHQYDLVLAPWYRYLAWSKVEGFYGLTRTSGPTFAGYFGEGILPHELGDQADHQRAILLDFCNLDVVSIRLLVKSLLVDTKRSGVLPLLASGTPVYCESWHHGQGLGHVIDAVTALPEITQSAWSNRISGLRVCLGALWSLIFEEGPGKGDGQLTQGNGAARAYFQIGVDVNTIAIRLCYARPNISPREAITNFWPDTRPGAVPAQLLVRYADFVRVHHVPEPSDIEVTIGFFANSPCAEAYHGQVHTIWIEPVSASTVTEMPFETDKSDPDSPLKPLPVSLAGNAPAEPKQSGSSALTGSAKAQRFILEAAAKIRELKSALTERDDMIRELRSGGVGTARALPPPDVESLIEAFQERLLGAGFQIEQLEEQVAALERNGGTAREIEGLRQKMAVLAQKQQAWLRQIASTIELMREAGRRRAGAGSGG